MRRIGEACLIYADSHHGRYPDDLETILREEDLAASTFVCPSSNDVPAPVPATRPVGAKVLTPGHVSYVYLGKGLTAAAPVDVVVMYEPLLNHGGDGMNVLFADGHVEWYSKADAQPLLKQIAAGVRPVHTLTETRP